MLLHTFIVDLSEGTVRDQTTDDLVPITLYLDADDEPCSASEAVQFKAGPFRDGSCIWIDFEAGQPLSYVH